MCLIILAFLLGVISRNSCKRKIEPKPKIVYETKYDTIREPYKVTEIKYKEKVKPYRVITYSDTFKLENVRLRIEKDSLLVILDSLSTPLPFKLLRDIKLDFDTLRLTFLQSTLKTQTYEYPLDFSTFKYEWQNNTLYPIYQEKELCPYYAIKNYKGTLEVMSYYDLVSKKYGLGIHYRYGPRKLSFNVFVGAGIKNTPTLIGLSYRLYE